MSSLVLTSQPGFTEVPAANFNAGNAASDADLKAVNDDARFATVRNEEFWGYYKHGEQVQLPVSPADGYTYARSECYYLFAVYNTGAPPAGALNGTQSAPTPGSTSGPGTMLQFGGDVDINGNVTCVVEYWNGSQHHTTDGILKVHTFAKRQR